VYLCTTFWRDGRVVDCSGLENRRTERYRGFESLSLRKLLIFLIIITMKQGIHPESYRPVAFKDMSNDETFISRSTVATKETIDIDGVTYPLVKLEISSSSHPFYTGKSKLVDTAGRVDKFMNRYQNRMDKKKK
jgi:large subunit ribosomal protein L31